MGWELHKVQPRDEVEKLLIMQLRPQPWGFGEEAGRGQCFHGDWILVICLEAVLVPAVTPLRDGQQLQSFMGLVSITEDSVTHSIHSEII